MSEPDLLALVDWSLRHWQGHPRWDDLRDEAYWAVKREMRLKALLGTSRPRIYHNLAQWAAVSYLERLGEEAEEVHDDI